MTVDQTINAWLAPIADGLGKVTRADDSLLGCETAGKPPRPRVIVGEARNGAVWPVIQRH